MKTLLILSTIATSVWVSAPFANVSDFSPQSMQIAANTKESAPSDTAITANVKSKFLNEKLFGDADISAITIKVETNNGVVHLTGTADNKNQIDNAVKFTKNVEGVKSVVNDVKVKTN